MIADAPSVEGMAPERTTRGADPTLDAVSEDADTGAARVITLLHERGLLRR